MTVYLAVWSAIAGTLGKTRENGWAGDREGRFKEGLLGGLMSL